MASCATIVVIACLARFSIRSVWDDSYIVVRYADNLIASGDLAWNPGGPTTYGLTSPLYLVVVMPLRLISSGGPALAVSLSSLLCGLAVLVLLLSIARRMSQTALETKAAVALVAFALTSSIEPLANHFLSGMDTTFAMAHLAIYVLLLQRRARLGGTATLDTLVGIWGGVAFFARPDLLLFTLSVPIVLVVSSETPQDRRRAWRVLGSTLMALFAQLLFTTWYFGSTLPLPFYAKGLMLYDDSVYAQYAGVAIAQLKVFVRSYWLLIVPAGLSLFVAPSDRLRRAGPLEIGILTGTILFIGYHAFFVLPIMYDSQRFYYPALPAIVYLGVGGALRLHNTPSLSAMRSTGRLLLITGGAAFVLWSVCTAGIAEWRRWNETRSKGAFARFSTEEHFALEASKVWPGLDVVARLPDDLVIAATEVGFPAAMNPHKGILDLAGLNETDIARGRASQAALIRSLHPDVIYLPHPDYRAMNQLMRTDADFLSHYEMARQVAKPPMLDVAILREGRHYKALSTLLSSHP